ncbi:hypothetical protein KO507_06315 [Gilvimarinus agarilyticus]|uniref:hypothetical protein n=1 Tax=Gilvimarinus sp. 2_MG-2023 TaxID=3062666 RepID=UPI001C087F4E|nr:hypothetical protein [Gilvimarinus sp. 2_MG-2023]MBU2885371.1 hypothetical protein [Gilvimarinus agarilyticus]MDO6570270.1 hypothetical protein [Gilvimarinus sp. 2_MG-2023]
MDELARQKYLNALGIDGYMPRVRLPHAPQPVLCAIPETLVQASSHTPAQALMRPETEALPARSTPKENVESVGQVLAGIGGNQERKAAPKAPLKASLTPKTAGVKPVHLHLWRASPSLMIVDQHEPGMAFPKETLLTNILRATQQISQPLAEAERIRCPINDDLASRYREEDVSEELKAWINEELIKSPQANLWIFGLRPAQYLATPETKPEATFSQALVSCYGETETTRRAAVLPSLTELLQTPDLKRQVWQTLQAREYK